MSDESVQRTLQIFMSFQIDSSNPTLNLTVIPDLLNNGTLALQLHKLDTGSGVDGVDIYQLTGEQMYRSAVSTVLTFTLLLH